jgi:hypothetical protein
MRRIKATRAAPRRAHKSWERVLEERLRASREKEAKGVLIYAPIKILYHNKWAANNLRAAERVLAPASRLQFISLSGGAHVL